MRRLIPVLLVLTACAAPLQTGVFLGGRFDIPDALVADAVPADSMRYLLRFPPGYEPGDDLPLVVFLHGAGDDDYDSRWLTAYGFPALLTFDMLPVPDDFVVLAPQAAPGTSWDMGRQPDVVMALIDDIVARHQLDPVVLTGVSMGGYGAWHLATRHPDRFARVASVSGSGYGTADLPPDLDVCRLAGVELRAYHGTDDLVADPDLVDRALATWSDACRADVDLRIVEGSGHFETIDAVYRDTSFYDWFLVTD
ncbi:MAG TPA: alpha/beta fold hydrolase [Acidimicrobiia bacterium]|nr:alpha/beta fold hydrolase [Acidimicrobiia bacterium]